LLYYSEEGNEDMEKLNQLMIDIWECEELGQDLKGE
jgi:hypothetical protein